MSDTRVAADVEAIRKALVVLQPGEAVRLSVLAQRLGHNDPATGERVPLEGRRLRRALDRAGSRVTRHYDPDERGRPGYVQVTDVQCIGCIGLPDGARCETCGGSGVVANHWKGPQTQ